VEKPCIPTIGEGKENSSRLGSSPIKHIDINSSTINFVEGIDEEIVSEDTVNEKKIVVSIVASLCNDSVECCGKIIEPDPADLDQILSKNWKVEPWQESTSIREVSFQLFKDCGEGKDLKFSFMQPSQPNKSIYN
jgi:hypothetical protein